MWTSLIAQVLKSRAEWGVIVGLFFRVGGGSAVIVRSGVDCRRSRSFYIQMVEVSGCRGIHSWICVGAALDCCLHFRAVVAEETDYFATFNVDVRQLNVVLD
jgi:hypothetical protein